MDAESAALALALGHPNVTLQTGAMVRLLETDASGRRIERVVYTAAGQTRSVSPRLVVLAAGAAQSAVLLLRSANARFPKGLANSSDQVGRNFMNHNSSVMPRVPSCNTNAPTIMVGEKGRHHSRPRSPAGDNLCR